MKTAIHVFVILFFILMFGCYTVKEITDYKELAYLRQVELDEEIQIVTCDTTVYFAENFTFTDSTISIKGTRKKNLLENEYEGTLYFRDISYIQCLESHSIEGVVFVGATGFIVGYGLQAAYENQGITPIVVIRYPGGGGGCDTYK